MINRNTLPQDVQDILKTILEENPEDLNEEAFCFLSARRGYLTNAEIATYFSKPEVKVETIKPIIKRNRKQK